MRWPSRRRARRALLILALLAGAVYGTWYARKAWHRSELVGRLSATHTETVQAAAEELGDMGSFARTAVPALIKVAHEKTLLFYKYDGSEARVAALVALGKIGVAAEPAVPAILEVGHNRCLYASLEALVRIEDATGRVVPYLLRIAGDKTKEQELRVRAVVALGAMGHRADSTLPALLELISAHEHDDLSRALWTTAGRLKPDDTSVAKAVAKAAELVPIEPSDRLVSQCVFAARCFGNWGAVAKPAIPVLIERAKRLKALRWWLGDTFEALARIDPKWGETEAGRGLLPILIEHAWQVNTHAFEAFGAAAVPHLLGSLSVRPRDGHVPSAAVLDRIDRDWRTQPAAQELLTSCRQRLRKHAPTVHWTQWYQFESAVMVVAAIQPDWFATPEGRFVVGKLLDHCEQASRDRPGISDEWRITKSAVVAAGTAAKPVLPRVLKMSSISTLNGSDYHGDQTFWDWVFAVGGDDPAVVAALERNLPAEWACSVLFRIQGRGVTPGVRARLLKTAFERGIDGGRSNRAATRLLSQIDPNWGTWPEVPELLESLWEPHPDSVSRPTVAELLAGKTTYSAPPKNPHAPRVLATERAVPVLAAIGDQLGERAVAFSRELDAYPNYYDSDLPLRRNAGLISESTVARWKLGGRNRANAEFVLRYRAADPDPLHREGATAALARLGLN